MVTDVWKESAALRVSDGNNHEELTCRSFGGALLCKEFKVGDRVIIRGRYYPNQNPYNRFLELRTLSV